MCATEKEGVSGVGVQAGGVIDPWLTGAYECGREDVVITGVWKVSVWLVTEYPGGKYLECGVAR